MTIHAWGSPLWTSEIAAEFGDPGGRPLWLTNYYRGGGRVPNIGVNNAISISGYIAHSMFYGAANYPPAGISLGQYCSGYDLRESFTNGSGGSYSTLIESNSYSCGYVSHGSATWGAGTYYLTVPIGIYTIYVDHMLGGGGGGSGGSDGGYTHSGPGGYGGSAGTYWAGTIGVNPGDTLTIVVGGGGSGGLSSCANGHAGNAGGSTIIYRNGTQVAAVAGGGGAPANIHANDGISCAGIPGYLEYAPPISDEWGTTCPSGYTNDGLGSCYRSVGGTPLGPYPGTSSALGTGGAGGAVNAAGGAGGWGAGGGGGGCMIGSCVNASTGGTGGSGYAAIHW